MGEQVTIARRFRGPPESGNGGYCCGVVAAYVDGGPAATVTLREPPPLDRPLTVERSEEGAEMRDAETLVAEAEPTDALDLDVPDPVDPDSAERARRSSPLYEHHAYPTCFVCGPDAQDGLQIVSGPVPGREGELLASPWSTDPWMADDDGAVRPELVWAALDCPGGLAGMLVPDLGLTVLGRLTAELHSPLGVGETYVAIGWPLDRDGRKFTAASAVLDESGRVMARGQATWIELRDRAPGYGAA